ncbi:hypothetical protein CHARACLAT_015383 [Characodon lateralis]|uniref:Uncharacterized protein n=1 Tax=Characodon lateralis TaxID=208331 RepID=A0ABU7F4I3_9TELE|nr:hypothetical protein [Characodon lateralis]
MSFVSFCLCVFAACGNKTKSKVCVCVRAFLHSSRVMKRLSLPLRAALSQFSAQLPPPIQLHTAAELSAEQTWTHPRFNFRRCPLCLLLPYAELPVRNLHWLAAAGAWESNFFFRQFSLSPSLFVEAIVVTGFMLPSCVGKAMATPSAQQHHNQQNQDYFRSVSSESTTYMMVPTGGPSGTTRREAPSKMWLAMVVIVVVVLQIASTTGLFVYLNMSISQLLGELVPIPSGLLASGARTGDLSYLPYIHA